MCMQNCILSKCVWIEGFHAGRKEASDLKDTDRKGMLGLPGLNFANYLAIIQRQHITLYVCINDSFINFRSYY